MKKTIETKKLPKSIIESIKREIKDNINWGSYLDDYSFSGFYVEEDGYSIEFESIDYGDEIKYYAFSGISEQDEEGTEFRIEADQEYFLSELVMQLCEEFFKEAKEIADTDSYERLYM